jgi:hypothetical protein
MELIEEFYETMIFFLRDKSDILQHVNSTFLRPWSGSITQGTYIDKRVVENIHQNMKVHYNVNMMTTQTLIDLNIIGKTREEVESYKIPIILIISSFNHFMKKQFGAVGNKLTLHIYLTDLKKKCHARDDELTPFNVNTGFTSGGDTIVVYRKEELLKVLIHEMTHYFGIDDIYVPQDIEDKIRAHFNVTSSLYLREAITEFWACTMNVAYYSFIDMKTAASLVTFKRRFINNLIKETSFCEKQAKRIAHLVSYCEGRKYREQTHIISYYILKYVMLNAWNRYIVLYKNVMDKQAFLDNLLSDLEGTRSFICDKAKPKSRPKSLRMTSLDVFKKCTMKTI